MCIGEISCHLIQDQNVVKTPPHKGVLVEALIEKLLSPPKVEPVEWSTENLLPLPKGGALRLEQLTVREENDASES